MPTRIAKSFTFDAAHRLTAVPADHPCGRLHGHTYTVTLALEGEPDPEAGWLMDFGEIGRAFRPILGELDHACLNDLPGLENPTAERLARWLFDRLAAALPGLAEVIVQETPTSSASYRR
jgi:6-pyruvoyltetrahydropterin/6-carboxytetrahydropterin synthase